MATLNFKILDVTKKNPTLQKAYPLQFASNGNPSQD